MSIHLGEYSLIHVSYFTLYLNGTRQVISIQAGFALERYYLHCIAKKVYHPIFNDKIFNSRCPIPVIPGTVITE